MCGDVRLIPAHAGKTQAEPRSEPRPWAHPRSRGENARAPASPTSWRGSSPLTRGKLSHGWWGAFSLRLIPAHAGKTEQRSALAYASAAHPRSRGENASSSWSARSLSGSSPLTRGKPIARPHSGSCTGLIPAHAGKTAPGPTPARGWAAHPRSRGENVS